MPNINSSNVGAATARPTTVQEILDRQKEPHGRNIKIARTANDHLDKNSFLKLLVTQLSKQDPLQPVNDREFIAQMAQFSSLEQMNNVATSMHDMKSFQANFLAGREISGKDFVSGREISGVVDKIIYDGGGQVLLRVNGRTVKFEDVTSIGIPDNVSRETIQTEKNNQALIQKAIAEYVKNSEKKEVIKQTVDIAGERQEAAPNTEKVKPKEN